MVAPERGQRLGLARVRFHTETSQPAASRRSASRYPIRPAPIQPIAVAARCVVILAFPSPARPV